MDSTCHEQQQAELDALHAVYEEAVIDLRLQDRWKVSSALLMLFGAHFAVFSADRTRTGVAYSHTANARPQLWRTESCASDASCALRR